MGETRVDLQHLLEDLKDAYTGSIEETILTEVVANALDSGATRVQLITNAAEATLTIVDNGRGMKRRELARYHDVAASRKARGEGIGFAGVGIKLGLLISREVITETRRGPTHVASRWHLASRHRAPWRWIPAPGLLLDRGTAVQLVLANQLSPLLDAGYLEESIRRHFEPLLDSTFDELLCRHYPSGVTFEVDGREATREDAAGAERAPVFIRLGRRRLPSAAGFVERSAALPAHREGIAVSTFGKVIKRGWDWLGLVPSAHGRIGGLIEVPDLAACLTLSKSDFIRTGPRGASYLAYRKAIQEVVSRQLTAWGDERGGEAPPRSIRLERDLERVLEDLSDDFPLLRSLVDRSTGGQKPLPMPGRGHERVPATLFAGALAESGADFEGAESRGGDTVAEGDAQEPDTQRNEPGKASDDRATAEPEAAATGGAREEASLATASGALETVPGRRRRARYGLSVQFESRSGDLELARLVDSTIWINDSHPAYGRAVSSRSAGYHMALAVALALAPLAVETHSEHAFITQFLAYWGGSQTAERAGRRRRATR